jgi:hypothetical protein
MRCKVHCAFQRKILFPIQQSNAPISALFDSSYAFDVLVQSTDYWPDGRTARGIKAVSDPVARPLHSELQVKIDALSLHTPARTIHGSTCLWCVALRGCAASIGLQERCQGQPIEGRARVQRKSGTLQVKYIPPSVVNLALRIQRLYKPSSHAPCRP